MHFLARLLSGKAAITEELVKDEQLLHNELALFFQSYAIKEDVLNHLMHGEPIHLHIHKLEYALKDEIKIIVNRKITNGDLFNKS